MKSIIATARTLPGERPKVGNALKCTPWGVSQAILGEYNAFNSSIWNNCIKNRHWSEHCTNNICIALNMEMGNYLNDYFSTSRSEEMVFSATKVIKNRYRSTRIICVGSRPSWLPCCVLRIMCVMRCMKSWSRGLMISDEACTHEATKNILCPLFIILHL